MSARVIADLAEMSHKLADNSYNEFYGVMLQALCSSDEQTARARPSRLRMRLSANRKKLIIPVDGDDELPTLARIIAIHTLTTGKITCAGLDFMIGITDARYGAAVRIPKQLPATGNYAVNELPAEVQSVFATQAGAFRKWEDFATGGYTAIRFETSGTFRNWIGSSALQANGISAELLKWIDQADGVQVRTHKSYQAIVPVTPIGP